MPRLPLASKQQFWELAEYRPSPEQLKAHESPATHVVIIGGEGGGKSYSGSLELAPHGMLPPYEAVSRRRAARLRNRLYWLVGPDYEACRPEFIALAELYEDLDMLVELNLPREGACTLRTKTGANIETRSAENPQKCMSGRGPQGILYCEMGMLTNDIFERGRTRLARSEEPGAPGWSWGSGIIQNSLPWFLEMYDIGQQPNERGVATIRMPTWTNEFTFPGGLDNAKMINLKNTLSQVDWDERIAAEIAAPSDIVFPEFDRARHVRPLEFQKWILPRKLETQRQKYPVYLAVDPGYSPGSYAVVAVQQNFPAMNCIDEIYEQKKGVEEIIEICKRRPWWDNVSYVVLDPFFADQHQAQQSHAEAWRRYSDKRIVVPNRRGLTILEGIRRYREFLSRGPESKPYIFFDPKCRRTIREHRLYRRKPTPEGQQLREVPVDRDNHAIKALIYLIWATRGPSGFHKMTGKRRVVMDTGRTTIAVG
jgi:hypothetical protein